MFMQHKRNRRAVDRANMSSDYQKERPPENQGRQINTTAHKHRPMCEQLGFGRLARIVKDAQFDPRCLRRNVNIRRPGMGNLAAFHSPKLPRQWMVRSVQSTTSVSGQCKTAKVVPTIFPSMVGA